MRFRLILSLLLLINTLSYSLEFMHPDQIKPGMKGYGLTVFKGWEPKRFEVEIIDVMKNVFPDGDMILARVSGPDIEKSGVASGMSGSPIYIDGKLIGALAFTWPYANEPVAGITPIGMMLKEKDNADPTYFDENSQIKPISTPLMVSGISGPALTYLEQALSNRGYVFTQGGGSGYQDSSPEALKPGDSVSLNIVDGDLNLSAIGTVTHVDGKDVFIFGHPMNTTGNLSLPVSKSYIYTIMSSSYLSFKMGAASRPQGATVYDGRTAVYCELGRPAGMTPVSVKIKTWKSEKTYNYRIASHSDYFSSLLASTLLSSMTMQAGYLDEKSITLKFKMDLEYDGKIYSVTNQFYYSMVPSFFEVFSLMADLDYLFATMTYARFGRVRVVRADFEVQIDKGVDYYLIDNIVSDQQLYRPGDTVNLKVFLKKNKGKYFSQNIQIHLDESLSEGSYRIFVGNDYSRFYQEWKAYPHVFQINTMQDLMGDIQRKVDPYKMSAFFVVPVKGIVYQDKNLADFPETYIRLLNFRDATGKYFKFPETYSYNATLDLPVVGGSFVNVNIAENKVQKVK